MEKRANSFHPVEELRSYLSRYERPSHMVCALSGGADSVCLLYAMHQISQEEGIKMSALHVHHGIRGEHADADEQFCRDLCSELGVDFAVEYVDTPSYASERHMSIESAARELRYQKMREYASTLGLNARVFLAHNATDQAETIIFRLARGTGLHGLSGIPQQRDVYMRPFLHVEAGDIRAYLDERGLAYRIDETNLLSDYTRNRIRHQWIPALDTVHRGAIAHIAKMADILREDESYILGDAVRLLAETPCYKRRDALRRAHPALAKRAIRLLHQAEFQSHDAISAELLEIVYRAICSEDNYIVFTLPGDVRAVVDNGYFYCTHATKQIKCKSYAVDIGLYVDEERSCALLISNHPVDLREYPLLNVYNSVTHQTFASDKIKGSLFVRSRKSGDSYTFGGMTRKVNTLFSDAHLPRIERVYTPIICDEDGIVWVPPFAARDASKPTMDCDCIYIYYFSRLEKSDYEC